MNGCISDCALASCPYVTYLSWSSGHSTTWVVTAELKSSYPYHRWNGFWVDSWSGNKSPILHTFAYIQEYTINYRYAVLCIVCLLVLSFFVKKIHSFYFCSTEIQLEYVYICTVRGRSVALVMKTAVIETITRSVFSVFIVERVLFICMHHQGSPHKILMYTDCRGTNLPLKSLIQALLCWGCVLGCVQKAGGCVYLVLFEYVLTLPSHRLTIL